jgi:hypothetical protein
MSDTTGKTKLIRNADRSKPPEYKPYVPQYQVHGVEPQEYHGAVVPGGAVQVARPNPLPNDNPRARRAPVRQPYAEATTSPIGRGPVPNVGNNMEHTWPSDGAGIVDDLTGEEVDPNQAMVDNNDFVTDQAFGFQNGLTAANIPSQYTTYPAQAIEQEVQATHRPADPNDLVPVLTGLEEDAHLLIVSGVPVCSGPREEIEEQARLLVFGEHEMCAGEPVPVDDIIILKRVKVKVGLFLE